MMNHERLCKEFYELTGKRVRSTADVLRIMVKDLGFITTQEFFVLSKELKEMIDVDMIIKEDALLKAAVKWLKEEKK
jgi:EAL domain-containing protein (putative c-di-GMP-specific phosphodiesterase class I)